MKKTINILLLLAATAALVVTAVGLKRWSASAKTNKDALAVLLEKNTALKAQIADLKSPASTSRQVNAAEATTKNAALKKQIDEQQSERRKKREQGDAQFKAYLNAKRERMAHDREFSLKRYASMRSEIDVQYGPFYRLQQLTKQQSDALAEALFQRKLRYEKWTVEQRIGGSNADAKAAKTHADAEFAAAAREVLGANLHEQFLLYERKRGAWDYVGLFGGMLSLVDMPLSMEQASRMVDTIANENSAFKKGNAVDMFVSVTNWDAVNAAAAEFLTPEQLDFLKNVSVSDTGGTHGNSSSQQEQEYDLEIKKLGTE